MPTVVGVETAGPTSTSSLTIDRPSAAGEGTLLIARVLVGSASGTHTPTAPSGWTEVRSDTTSDGSQFHPKQYVYTLVAGASEPSSYEWTIDSDREMVGEIVAVDAHDGLDTDDGHDDSSASSLALPDVTVAEDGSLYIGFWGAWRSSRSGTWDAPPASMTEMVNLPGTAASSVPAAMSAREDVDSGATGSRSADLTGDIDRLVGSVVIVAPGVDLPTAEPDAATVTVAAHVGAASVAAAALTAEPDAASAAVSAHVGAASVPEPLTAEPDAATVTASAHVAAAYVPPVAVPDPGYVHASARTGRASRAGDSITTQPDAATVTVSAHTGDASGGVGLADMAGDMAFTIVGTARLEQDPQVSPVPDGVALRRIRRVAETMPDPTLDEGVPVG